jgi:hypothetical protein
MGHGDGIWQWRLRAPRTVECGRPIGRPNCVVAVDRHRLIEGPDVIFDDWNVIYIHTSETSILAYESSARYGEDGQLGNGTGFAPLYESSQ